MRPLEYGELGQRTIITRSIVDALARLRRPLGTCQVCRAKQADRLVQESRGGTYKAECRGCAAGVSTREARRRIDAFEAEYLESDLTALERTLGQGRGR